MSLVTPIVHSNGTSKAELLQLREDVYTALDAALAALRQAAPNGRDHYLIPGQMVLAEAQHTRRMKAITDLMAEMEEECREIEQATR